MVPKKEPAGPPVRQMCGELPPGPSGQLSLNARRLGRGNNRRKRHVPASIRHDIQAGSHPAELRQLHWRQVRRTGRRPLFRQSEPHHRREAVSDRAFIRRRHRARARRRPQGKGRLGQDASRRAIPSSSTRSPTRWRPTSICSRSSRRSTTASRSARRPTPTCRYASTTGAITPASFARRKAAFRRSTTTPSPIISMSRSASSARSFPGTSRC